LSGLLGDGAQGTAPCSEQVSAATSFKAVLLSDLSSDGNHAAQGTTTDRD